MKQYLDLMRKIKDEGHDHEDRTGIGRRSIFATQLRFDLSQGDLPVVTTRSIPTDKFIKELLWFISGSVDNKVLKNNGVNIWNLWELKEEDLSSFFDKYIKERVKEGLLQQFKDNNAVIDIGQLSIAIEEQKKVFIQNVGEERVGMIGPMYGFLWRSAPGTLANPFKIHRTYEDIPSDKLQYYKDEYLKTQDPNSLLGADDKFKEFALMNYMSSIDQLNELVLNLKNDPYSSRHVVTALVPQFFSIPGFSPQENIVLDKGSLYPCHMLFQCFVSPAKEEGGKLRLSLKMTQRSVDYPIGCCFNIAQYALLTHLLAHVTDMEPYEFIWDGGDVHIYVNQLPLIDEQLSREPQPMPKVWLNPEVKDLFQFTPEDIKVLDYNPLPAIKYPISM